MSRGVAVNDNVIDLINYGGAFYWNDTEEVFSPKISQIGENKGWMPIGNAAVNSFKGSFDGNNIEVSNLSAWCTADDNARANFGLFGNVDFSASGSIKNLVLNRVQAKSTNVAANIGAVVGTGIFNVNNIAISNCSVKNTIPIANSSDFFLKTVMEDKDHATLGGIIGSAENIKIQNCKVDGTIELENKMVNVKSPAETGNKNATEQGKGLGGIVGSLNVNSTLQDNDTNIVYNVKNNKTEFGYIGINTFFGGIVGITNNIGINILNNISSVKLTANYSADGVGVGGIVGGSGIVLPDTATKINLTNNIATTKVTINTKSYERNNSLYPKSFFGGFGGILGMTNADVAILKCIANVDINTSGTAADSYANIGGIVGSAQTIKDNISAKTEESFSTGNICGKISSTYNDTAIGGIYGRINTNWGSADGYILNSYSNVTIDAKSISSSKSEKSGGFSGFSASNPNMFKSSYFSGFLLNPWSVSLSSIMNNDPPNDASLPYYDYQNSPAWATIHDVSNRNNSSEKLAKSFADFNTSANVASLSPTIWNITADSYPSLKWVDDLTGTSKFTSLAKAYSKISTSRHIAFINNDHSRSVTNGSVTLLATIALPNAITANEEWKKGDAIIPSGAYTMTAEDEKLSTTIKFTLESIEYIVFSEKRICKKTIAQGNGLQYFNGANSAYQIASVNDLINFGKVINNNMGFVGMSAKLTSTTDYSLAGYSFTDAIISSNDVPYVGYFDGNNKLITGMKIDSPTGNTGLFGNIQNSIIQNMNITGANILSDGDGIGILVGNSINSQIINSSVKGSVSSSNGSDGTGAGGIVGVATNTSEMKNLSFVGAVVGKGNIGSIVGLLDNSTVSSSNASATIGEATRGAAVGGLVGGFKNDKSSIVNSFFNGVVNGTGNVGGLCGNANKGTITASYVLGNINGYLINASAGGLVGASSANVSSCYFSGQINSDGKAGGLSGNSGSFTNCFFDKQLVGALLATTQGTDITASTAVTTAELALKQPALGSAFVAKAGFYPQLSTASNAVNQDTATRIMFDLKANLHAYNVKTEFILNNPENLKITNTGIANIGFQNAGDLYSPIPGNDTRGEVSFTITYPTGVSVIVKLIKPIFEIGNGTKDSPYEIPDENILAQFRDYINADKDKGNIYYKLTKPDGVYDLSATPNWKPIATGLISFSSNFDGNNKTIKNMTISVTDKTEQGFFGTVKGGYIKNLSIENAKVTITARNLNQSTSLYKAGILAGSIENSAINNITVKGDVTLNSTSNNYNRSSVYLGGVAGTVKNHLEFNDIYSAVNVTFKESAIIFNNSPSIFLGGVAGEFSNSTTNKSVNRVISYANITGTPKINTIYGGSIAAQITNTVNNFAINDCFTSGKIENATISGSLCAQLNGNSKFTVTKVNKITSTTDFSTIGGISGEYVGGIIGSVSAQKANISNCFFGGKIDNITARAGIVYNYAFNAEATVNSSYSDNSKNSYNGGNSGTQKSTKDMANLNVSGFTNKADCYPYSTSINSADVNQYGNSAIKADALSTVALNSIAVYYANAKNGVSSTFVLAVGASLETTNANIKLTTSGKRAVSTGNDTVKAKVTVNSQGEVSIHKKIMEYLPNIDSTGLTDFSYAIANPNGDGIDGSNSFTLYTADSLAGLSLLTAGVAIDGNKNQMTGAFGNATIKLGRDINADAYANFPVIGTTAKPYKNYFNGNYHTISNLKIQSTPYVGLFGVAQFEPYTGAVDPALTDYEKDNLVASIKNLGIVSSKFEYNGKMQTNPAIGSFVGKAMANVKIDSCFSSSTITTSSTEKLFMGGFVGYATDNNLSISNSFFTGNVLPLKNTNEAYAGGFIGNAESISTIKRSYVAGYIDGGLNKFGAVAGKATNSLNLIGVHSDTGATGNIKAIGEGSSSGSMINAETSALTTITDGVKPIGLDNNFPNASNNTFYYKAGFYPRIKNFVSDDTSAVPIFFIAHSKSVTSGEVKNTGYKIVKPTKPSDFNGDYTIAGNKLSKTSSGKSIVQIQNNTDAQNYRDVYMDLKCWVEITNPDGSYNISNAYELQEFALLINDKQPTGHEHKPLPAGFKNATFHLLNDIDLSVLQTPIEAVNNTFVGTLDGHGYVINNFATNVGLFSDLAGTVKNVGFQNSTIKDPLSNSVIGLLSSRISSTGKVINCYNTSDITFKDGNYTNVTVGGLVGEVSSGGVLDGCYNMGAISGLNSGVTVLGGIVGKNQGVVQNSYNTGILQGIAPNSTQVLSGIAGQNTGSIANCYNAALILNSLNIQPISSGTVTNSYYDKQINIEVYSNGIGKNTNELKALNINDTFILTADYYPRIKALSIINNDNCVISSYVSALAVDYIGPIGIGKYNEILRVQLPINGTYKTENDIRYNVKISENSAFISSGSFDLVPNGKINVLNPKNKGATYVSIFVTVNGKEIKRDFNFFIEVLLSVKYKFTFENFEAIDPDSVHKTVNEWNVGDQLGTAGKPFLIATAADLESFRAYVSSNDTTDKYFKLTSNINLQSVAFTSIGTDAKPFNGNFDGDSYEISNLSQVATSTGLFGTIGEKGKVRQVGLKNQSASVQGANSDLLAGLVSTKNNGVIQNCYSIGTMNISDPSVGKKAKAGGISAINKGRITGCYIRSSALNNIVYESSSTRKQDTAVGALVGENIGYLNGCYTVMEGRFITVAPCYVLAGINSGTISNTFFDSSIIGKADVPLYANDQGVEFKDVKVGKTTSELKSNVEDNSNNSMAHQLSWDLYLGTFEFVAGKNDGYPVCGGDLLSKYNFDANTSSIIFSLQNKKKAGDEYNASNAICSYVDFLFPQFGKLTIGENISINLLDLSNNLTYSVANFVFYGYNETTKAEIKSISPPNPGSIINTQSMVENCNRLEININIKKQKNLEPTPWGVHQAEVLPT
ncbi:MAG: hypothetical protein RR073_04140 [Clostridia bacterium]